LTYLPLTAVAVERMKLIDNNSTISVIYTTLVNFYWLKVYLVKRTATASTRGRVSEASSAEPSKMMEKTLANVVVVGRMKPLRAT